MSFVHRAAQVGFDAGADAYERGRPGFPQAAMEPLVAQLRIEPGRRVVDLAAGTGKLTRKLVPTGAAVVAVEPVEGMRRKFREMLPHVPLIAGVAEAMPFRDASLHAVTVAQAFHWFNGPAALRELHRVLQSGGRIGLVWNVRDEGGLSRSLTGLFDRYRSGAPAFRDRAWQQAFEETDLFTPLQTVTIEHEQRLSVDGFLDRAMSVSFMAALPEQEREKARDELLRLLPSDDDDIVLLYRCEVSWCERSG